jgi:hypothetical protein
MFRAESPDLPVEVPASGSLGGEVPRETAAEAEAGEARSPTPAKGKGGEEAMNRDKKPDPRLIPHPARRLPNVKPRGEVTMSQKKPETERREDDRKRINEELEFLIEMEDRMTRKEEKRDYDLEQLVEEAVDDAMAELRRALPPEELEIYEKCYRFFKRSNSTAIRWYTSEQILQRPLILRGVEK